MVKKIIFSLAFIIGIFSSVFLVGCKTKETGDNIGKKVEEGAEKTGGATSDLVSKITDTSMDYNKDDLRKDVEAKGYIAKQVEETEKPYFSAENTNYIINNEKFSVYQYNKEDKIKLEDDIKSITDNGMKINGVSMNWSKAPHIYKKGRIVVIYNGDNEIVLTEAKEILGQPILG